MKNYEINDETIAIISKGDKSKVITLNNEFIVEKPGYKILDDSCKFYGSSYLGRLHSVKEMLSGRYKLPIIVAESENMIFFPTKSSLEPDCCWINYSLIKNYQKTSEIVTKIRFYNNSEKEFAISKISLENQMNRSLRLQSILRQRHLNYKNIKYMDF